MKVLATLLMFIGLFIGHTQAKDIFCPLPAASSTPLSLLKYSPVPFRIQYHGFMHATDFKRYIFVVDGEMVYLQLNETAPQQFILKQVLENGQQVLIEDAWTHQLYVLNSGESSYVPGKFECVLLHKKTGQQLIFSDTKNRQEMGRGEILVSQKGSDLYVWEFSKTSEPILCVLPLKASK